MKKKLLELQKLLTDKFKDNASEVILIDNIFVSKLITTYPTLDQRIEICYSDIFKKFDIYKTQNRSEIFEASTKDQNILVDTYGMLMVHEAKEEEIAEKLEEENIKEETAI